jgi:indole-3-acetate monooxygenase
MTTATRSTLEQLADMLPVIRGRRQDIEAGRRMPRDLVEQLRTTGVFSLTVPNALGGQEAAPLELMHAIESVATADGSAGWCTMIACGSNIASGYMNEPGAREVFADPTKPTAGIAAPAGTAVRVDGGVLVNGRWSFASGITHCDWVWAGCLVVEDGRPRMTPRGPETVHVVMPVRDVSVEDTWHVSGLCGTGSNDFGARDLFVPTQRTFLLLDPATHREEALYQMPPMGLFVYQLACVSLGVARAALDELEELAQTKKPALYMEVLADKPVAQVDVARAEAALGASRALLYDVVEGIWHAVRGGNGPTTRQVALGRAAALQAVETAAAVTRTANTLGGGSTIYTNAALQRHVRDTEAVTHHFTVAPHVWMEAGRLLLGRQPTTPVF